VKPALIIVDMQNDAVHKDGYHGEDAKKGIPIDLGFLMSPVPNIKRLAAAFRKAGRPVIHVVMMLRPDYSDACFPYWKFERPIERGFHVEGTWGNQIIDELTPQKGDYIVVKKGYGGFHNTELEPMLRNLGVDTCVMTGVGTPVCVGTTVREGVNRNFRMIVVSDGTAALSKASHEAELRLLPFVFADVKTSDEVLKMLK